MILDENYWTRRYQNKNTPWQLPSVSSPLKHIIDQLPNKQAKILIPGAGNSQEALYLVESGFTNVHVLDISFAPLQLLTESIEGSGKILLIHEDFFEHSGKYDLILEQTFFCALESRFRESYPKKCHELLKKHGSVQGVLFNFTHEREEPPYGGTCNEYKNLFSTYFQIVQLETCLHSEPSRAEKELMFYFKKN